MASCSALPLEPRRKLHSAAAGGWNSHWVCLCRPCERCGSGRAWPGVVLVWFWCGPVSAAYSYSPGESAVLQQSLDCTVTPAPTILLATASPPDPVRDSESVQGRCPAVTCVRATKPRTPERVSGGKLHTVVSVGSPLSCDGSRVDCMPILARGIRWELYR